MKAKKINKEILESRKSLRKVYDQYSNELYSITIKIDKYLETIQRGVKGGL